MKVDKVDVVSNLGINAVAFSEQGGMRIVESECGYILLSLDRFNDDEDSDAGICLKTQLEGLQEKAVVEGLLCLLDTLHLSGAGLRCIRDYAAFLLCVESSEDLEDSEHVH